MRKYGESKTTRIMMATVPHVTSCLGLRKFQADGFLLTRQYRQRSVGCTHVQREKCGFNTCSDTMLGVCGSGNSRHVAQTAIAVAATDKNSY